MVERKEPRAAAPQPRLVEPLLHTDPEEAGGASSRRGDGICSRGGSETAECSGKRKGSFSPRPPRLRVPPLWSSFTATLRNWEQGRRQPTGAARVLLRIAAKHPKAVLEAVA